MEFLSRLFGLNPSAKEEGEARQAFADMQIAMDQETPEQRRRFYLEVAAQLGNKSADDALRDLQKSEANQESR
jgi:hypothetical protein